ncbi:MAG: response regulator transcription factor [Prolixibacteraceae bacterium]|jgi:two-component system, LytTR family, response regulator|nr:response regulator transcription factor [Prolixibacteraceae bacterium]MBT6834690.1 response regulator transcription factor [Bacteroidota bacterium]MBT6998076.1 response regulator transcription factor [Prolixibacteraceae bacterium]MBT7394648.1 response regulator transcription factor [Prolixibacteraceae bacterium]
MPAINAIIIDDEIDACELLQEMLESIGEYNHIKIFTDAQEGLAYVLNQPPHIIFLDIEMPGLNGIEIIKELQPWLNNVEVVFVTAYPEYGIEAAKNNAFDYLLKPVDISDLEKLTRKLTQTIQHRTQKPSIPNNKLIIWSTNGINVIRNDEILYLEADKNYTEIKLCSGKRLLTSQSLGKIEINLTTTIFSRISRKHIINSDYLSSIDFKTKQCCLKSNNGEVTLKYTRKISDFIKE